MGMDEKLLGQLAEKDEWINQLEESLRRAESEIDQLRQKVSELEARTQGIDVLIEEHLQQQTPKQVRPPNPR